MEGEHYCRSRELFHCFYITKDNVAGFVDKYGCNAEHTITITEDFAYVKYQHMTWHIRLNAFMVCEYDGWASYTEKDFRETYTFINEFDCLRGTYEDFRIRSY